MKFRPLAALVAASILPLSANAKSIPSDFQQSILETHNHYRALHDAPALSWDDALAKYAYEHAQSCKFKHTHGPYGENLAAGYHSVQAGISDWYNEEQFYSYSNPGFSTSTGHFTQLVWKSTHKIGCALVPCNGQHSTPGNYLVCEYSPAGNVVSPGYFSENVSPKQSEKAKV